MEKDPLIIAGKAYNSRLLVGTGKYSSEKQALEAIKASNSEIVTVAIRRVELDSENRSDSILNYITPCLLYTSPSPRDVSLSRMPSSA